MAKILIIDDSWLTRRGISGMLKNEHHEIVEAENGRIGMDILENFTPDCIILDLLMPELDGYGVLQELKDRGSEIPVIIMTADIQETAKQKALAIGAVAFLNKPPKVDDLIKTVNGVTGG